MDAVKEYEKAERLLVLDKITIGQFDEMLKPLRDVEPVRHGKWINIDIKDYKCQCSICGVWNEKMGNYCPNCGTKMDGKEQEHE